MDNNRENNINKITRKGRKRLVLVFLFVVLALVGLSIRLAYISVTNGAQYSNKVLAQQQYETKTIPYRRGDIVDRNGITLATSTKVYNLILDPKIIQSEGGRYMEPTILALCNCFGYSEAEIRELITANAMSQYVRMKKGMTYEEVEAFMMLQEGKVDILPVWFTDADGVHYSHKNIQGVWFEEEYVRNYPYTTLACDVIGFINSGNVGAWGLEAEYNEYLNGINGRKYGYLNSDSDIESVVQPPVDGNTIVSTIDLNIQKIVQNKIEEFQNTVGSQNTAVIIMNPNNGEIYSMASYPFYDLNSPRDLTGIIDEEILERMTEEELLKEYYSLWRNYCISDTYEPGSTAKIFTMAAALEEDTVKVDDTFMCKGVLSVGGWDIHCHNRYGHNKITLKESITYSCNVAMMEIAAKMGTELFAEYQTLLGIGELTGIDLPGEESADSLRFTAENMKAADLATNSFGQNFNVTMIQMVAAYAAMVNGGYYYEPHVMKEITDASGSTVVNNDKLLVRQVISTATSDLLKEYLEGVVTAGTAKNVAIEGYSIGGKTGTAEKSNKDKESYLVSFMGVSPANNPEVLIYVVVDEPNVEKQSNSTYASNLAKTILEEVLPYLNVYSTKVPEDDVPPVVEEEVEPAEPVVPEEEVEPETANPSYYEELEGSIMEEKTSISDETVE